MTFDLGDHVLAGLAGAAAGAVNAIAGGGTLISFPTLVALGSPNVNANVTNTVALCPGYFGGAYSQRTTVAQARDRLRYLSVASGLGGLTGSVLLVITDESVFKRLVPWLILLACALLGGQQRLRALVGARTRSGGEDEVTTSPVVACFAAYAVSIYGGYFGAGLGIMLLAVLGLLYDDSLPRLNAMKQLLALVVNVVAAIFFVGNGKVLWSLAAVMAPASLAGGVIGGRLVDVVPPKVLRPAVVTYGTSLAIYYLLR